MFGRRPLRGSGLRRWPLFLFALSLILAARASAQQNGNGPAPPNGVQTEPSPSQPAPTEVPATESITSDQIQLRLKQTQESAELSEETRAKVTGLYNQVLQQLQLAEQWAGKAAEFESERQRAPETLQVLQAELGKPFEELAPDAPPDVPVGELQQRLRQVETELEAAKKALADWEAEKARRAKRRTEIPQQLTDARSRLAALIDAPGPAATPDQPSAVQSAQKALAQAQKLAITGEVGCYEKELQSYDARGDLINARLDRAGRRVTQLGKLVQAWQGVVEQRRQAEAQRAIREARTQLAQAHPALRSLAEENARLAQQRDDLSRALARTAEEARNIDAQIAKLHADFQRITKRVAAAGLTNAIGQLLRKHRADLPAARPYRRALSALKTEIGTVQLTGMELEERRSEVSSVDAIVAAIIQELPSSVGEDERRRIEETAGDLLRGTQDHLTALLKDYDSHFDKLVELDTKERELVGRIEEFTGYIDRNVLWIRSTGKPRLADVGEIWRALRWITQPQGWQNAAQSVWGTAKARPVLALIAVVLLLALTIARLRLRPLLQEVGGQVARPTTDAMVHTVKALVASLLLAVPLPVLLWYVAWLAESPHNVTGFAIAVAAGLKASAAVLATTLIVRTLCSRGGLGEKHFRWKPDLLRSVRRHLLWATFILVPAFFIFATAASQSEDDAYGDTLGRLSFCVAFVALAVLAHKLLTRKGGALHEALRQRQSWWLYHLRHVWYALGVLTPAALGLAAIVGYYYTALFLGWLTLQTIWVFLGLWGLYALSQRWLVLQIQRRKLKEMREQRAADKARITAEGRTSGDEGVAATAEEVRVNVSDINEQSAKLLRTVVIIAGLVGVWTIWAEVLPALGILRDFTLWTNTVKTSAMVTSPDGTETLSDFTRQVPVTLADLVASLLVFLATLAVARNFPGLLEITILGRLPLAPSARYATATITRYIITVVGVVWTFNLIGIGWSKVQWLVAAMTVGLGFGLQEIFANFVSGLILLFEQPIRVGDAVTVGTTSGIVTRIRIRATTITDWDRKELIVPNKRFITGEVLNWTLTDSIVRIVIPVGLAHGSDDQLARDTLLRIATEHPDVLEDPPPSAMFLGITSVSMNFELRGFIKRENYGNVLNELNSTVEKTFKEVGLQIAVPRQEMLVRPTADQAASAPPAFPQQPLEPRP